MDTFENNEQYELPIEEEPLPQEEAVTPPEECTRFEQAPLEPAAEEPKPRHKKKRRRGRGLTGFLFVVAVAACASTIFFCSRLTAQEKRTEQMLYELNQQILALQEELNSKSFTGNGNSISGTGNTTPDGSLTPGQVYAKVVDSVVAVTSRIEMANGSQITTGMSYGSGFILTADGYVVTNYHVVEDGTSLSITMHNGTEYPAQLCGYDSTNDIAVLKVDADGLPFVTLGSSKNLIVGDQVAVIGNPLGELTSTLTVGYISAKDRIISTDGSLINMLQTDASVNSGNSGGPIFNMNGEVVGIITAKYSGTSGSGASIEGIGFAIPIDDVVKKIADLKEFGYVTGAYLGVLVQDMDQTVAEYYGLPMGVYVSGVTDGFCAKEAGVQAKDIIIALGEYQVTNLNSLTNALQNFEAGDTTTITVWRAGLELELEITLDEKPRQ